MVEQQERLWEFDAVAPGQAGASTVVDITAENIAEYARVSLNDHPRYRADGGRSIPMPTMVLSYAPLLRDEIAEANGFVALEQSRTARRQTPFAKCEIRWERPVKAGDSITGTPPRPGEVRKTGQQVRHVPCGSVKPGRAARRVLRLHLHLRVRQGPAGDARHSGFGLPCPGRTGASGPCRTRFAPVAGLLDRRRGVANGGVVHHREPRSYGPQERLPVGRAGQ